MHLAIVDIGSNTVRMCVYCVEQDGSFLPMHRESRTLELYAHVADEELDAAGEAMLVETLHAFSATLTRLRIANRYAFATAGFRKLRAADALCARLFAATGWEIAVLSGETEAACSFAGLLSQHRDATHGMMIDMGGGSTEFLSFADRRATSAVSEPFGCVSLRTRFVKDVFPTAEEAANIRAFVKDAISALELAGDDLYLIGGTAKAMGALYRKVYNLRTLEPARVAKMIARFGVPSAQDRALLTEMFPERAASAATGMLAYGSIFEVLKPKQLIVSGAGVREGYLKLRLAELL